MARSPAVLSVDLELFTHLPAYRTARGRTDRRDIGLDAVDDLIALFDDCGAAATFFVVSEVAERHPERVTAVADAGHEIASHTHRHRHLSTLTERERREELDTSRTVLEDVTDTPVTGFRAPSFDTSSDHFTLLAAAGYEYDSSVVPCRRVPGWYGGEYDIDKPVPATRLDPDASDDLTELPVSAMPGLRLPLTGTWLRFFGPRYTVLGMKSLARRGIAPVLYIHPWELADLPAVDGVPKRVYWHTGAWMRRALRRILDAPFEFVTARTIAEERVESGRNANRTDSATTADDGFGGR
jgi:peptidoglycan/xylan/chitin deacetylase (PgdA/CDA1 family)